MNLGITLLAAASTLGTIAAYADGIGAYQVYDARGTLVGQLLYQNNVVAQIYNRVYDIEVNQNGLIADASFYFASSDCTGRPFLPFWLIGIPNEQGLLQTAWYQAVGGNFVVGNVFWDVDTSQPEQLTPIGSQWIQQLDAATDKVSATCETLPGSQSILAQPATPLDYNVKPPFCVSRRGDQPCQAR